MKRYSFSLSRVLAPQNGTRTRHVLLKQSQSQFKKFQQGPENFVENLGNDPGGTGGGGKLWTVFLACDHPKKIGTSNAFYVTIRHVSDYTFWTGMRSPDI